MENFKVASFNVRGLCDNSKRDNLGVDMIRYGVDVACLQETKMKKGCSETINGCNLTSFPTTQDAYGLEFMVSEKWSDKIHKQWKVSDRIADTQRNPKIKNAKKYTKPMYKCRKMAKGLRIKCRVQNNRNMITIINSYAPHSELTKQKPKDTEKFYGTLDTQIRKLKNKSSYE
jgi:exonuclease III